MPLLLSDTVFFVSGKTPLSLVETIDNTFQAREGEGEALPFREGRFGDGTIGVYYSAIEEDTCKKEVAFYLNEQIKDLNRDKYPRTYHSIECHYEGATVDLRGKEKKYPNLVSNTKTGYPFCQDLARRAVERGIVGFLAPSARNPGGTCVPVFRRTALSDPRSKRRYCATVRSGRVQFQKS